MKRKEKHGYGVEKTSNGFYEGEFVNGKRHGFGTLSDSDGTYKGEFKDGKKEGHGEFVWKFIDGHRFVGEYKNDKRVKGRKVSPDGDSYFGEYHN